MRLTDIDSLKKTFHDEWDEVLVFDESGEVVADEACRIIDDAPTIDAVYVVRCKDCKHNQGNACDYSAVWTRPNGFCQWGERKEDETA